MTDRKWYVLRVLTGYEHQVATMIQEKDLASAIVPVRVIRERKKGILHKRQRVLMPGYVFIDWEESTDGYYRIIGVPRVIRFLKTDGGAPLVVPEEQMAPVLILANGGYPFEESKAYREGDKIRIYCGPLKDLEGYIVKTEPRNNRATLNIPLQNYEIKVHVGLEMIEKAP